jgi:hypothetical protein
MKISTPIEGLSSHDGPGPERQSVKNALKGSFISNPKFTDFMVALKTKKTISEDILEYDNMMI